MTKPVSLPHTFGTQGGNVPASELDDDYTALQTAINDVGTYANYAQDSGVVNAYIVNFAAGITFALVEGIGIQFKPANSNSGASTVNVGGTGAVAIVNQSGAVLSGGELIAGRVVSIVYDGTNWQVNAAIVAPTPTIQVFSSGSGTYHKPAGCTWINVRVKGGGGGGAGSGSGSPGAGGNGVDSTFGTITAHGGTGGSGTGNAAGGTATGGDINLTGGVGGAAPNAVVNHPGGMGGANGGGGPVGPAGVQGNTAGVAAPANSGGGGGGASCGATPPAGGGGGGGGYSEKLISSPAATYSYSVGTGGAGGTAGTSGSVGGAGGSGEITVFEGYD